MLGDNAYYSGFDDEYQAAVFDMYSDLLRRTVLWPTIGNHDAGDDPGQFGTYAATYLDIFSLPRNGEAGGLASGTEHYYSFDYANIHLVCLDSFLSDRSPNGAMLTWLKNDLAATDKDWIIAFWHHPPYSWGTHNSDYEVELIEMREGAMPILEAYGADLVLSGHSHDYERTFLLNGHYAASWELQPEMVLDATLGSLDLGGPYRKPAGGLGAHQGIVCAVCGCSGEGGLPEDRPRHPAMAVSHGGYGSMILEVDGLKLRGRFLRPELGMDDDFTIDKSAPASVGPAVTLKRAQGGAVASWPTSLPPFALETAPTPQTPQWNTVQAPVSTIGRQNVVNLEMGNSNGFFRLRSGP
jgi:hypothetical protein